MGKLIVTDETAKRFAARRVETIFEDVLVNRALIPATRARFSIVLSENITQLLLGNV